MFIVRLEEQLAGVDRTVLERLIEKAARPGRQGKRRVGYDASMETLEEKLALIDRHVARAVAAVVADAAASPVLRAVVGEFEKKSRKARESIARMGAAVARESVVEMEQAADSARVAAEADSGSAAETRKAVSVAHDAICLLKHEQGG